MNDIVYTKMTYNEYYTGVSLVNSALSYKYGVLVVDKDKILGEVEKAESSMIAEVWKLQGGASQQNVQDIKSKYGTSSISGNDPIPKNDNYVKYAVNDDEIPKKIYGDNFKESKTPEVKISETKIAAEDIKFSDKFSKGAYKNQVSDRGWSTEKIANTINNPYKTGDSIMVLV